MPVVLVETTVMHFSTSYGEHVYFKAFYIVCCGSTAESYHQVVILTHYFIDR